MSEETSQAGRARVAAFLLSLGSEAAAAVLKHMREDVLAEVARAMLELDPKATSREAVESLYRKIALELNGRREVRPWTSDELSKALTSGLGKARADATLQEVHKKRRKERPFIAVESHPPSRIARALQQESPAVAALVLSNLPAQTAAEVLRDFPSEAAVEIVRRMTVLATPSESVIQAIAHEISESLDALALLSPERDRGKHLKSIADILNNAPPALEKGVFEKVSADDAPMAEQLREFMFTWEDIAGVNKRAMQKILGTVDTKTLSIALKGCTSAVEANIFGSLSSRVRDMVAEERELAGAQPMSEVQNARKEIMKAIRALIESGEFRPSRGGETLVT